MLSTEQRDSLLGFLFGQLQRKKRECKDHRVQTAIKEGNAHKWIEMLDNTKDISWRDHQEIVFKMKDGKRYALRFVELEL